MKPISHKESLTIHAGPTVTLDTVAAQTSIAQTIAQAFGDNTMPPQPGSSSSFLPSPFHNPDIGNLAAHFADPGSTDPSQGNSQADPLSGIAADVAAEMARLTGMDLANPSDPTQKDGINIGPGLPSADALKAALAQDGIVVNATSGTLAGGDPSKGGGQTAGSGSGHLQAPDGPPPESSRGSDPGHNMLGDMLSAKVTDETGNKWEKERDYTDKNGDAHHQTTTQYYDNDKIVVDVDKTSGVVIKEEDFSDGEVRIRILDPKTNELTIIDKPAGSDDYHAVTYKDGKVVYDSDDHKGGGAKMPDGDNQSTLPSWLANQIRNELYHEAKKEHPGNHDGDTINVRNDGPDTASANDLTGTHIDKMKTLLGGDTTLENSQQAGHVGGTPQPNYNGQAGAIDPGPDSDLPSQNNGPTPHDQHHVIATNPAGSHPSGGQQGNGDGQNSHQTLLPIKHLEAATTEDLVKAYEASQSGDHKTAQSVEGGAAGHDIASVLGSNSGGHDTGTPHVGLTAEIHTSALTFAGDSVESLFVQHNAAGAPGNHGTQATLQDVLHGISFSELNPNLLSALNGVHTEHALGSEANLFGGHDLGGQNLGGHDLGGHDLIAAHQPEPVVPHLDGGMLMHSELATWHSELAHQLF